MDEGGQMCHQEGRAADVHQDFDRFVAASLRDSTGGGSFSSEVDLPARDGLELLSTAGLENDARQGRPPRRLRQPPRWPASALAAGSSRAPALAGLRAVELPGLISREARPFPPSVEPDSIRVHGASLYCMLLHCCARRGGKMADFPPFSFSLYSGQPPSSLSLSAGGGRDLAALAGDGEGRRRWRHAMAAMAGWVVGNARVRRPTPRHVADSALSAPFPAPAAEDFTVYRYCIQGTVGIARPCISIIVARPCGEDYDGGGRYGEGGGIERAARAAGP
ncbi:hypothetical protein HU200_037597 [Digitaria exilis]|uniref:Uncharacterized protein n=1 Tax=Digitaria exilis TaxID=1010633 RepID=A0A835BK18_9POAL|nr:hypothetical protein HU200_037597 [Digitaria exilis]CAB3453466.1 unnamed protein product [Digitaria exilis]